MRIGVVVVLGTACAAIPDPPTTPPRVAANDSTRERDQRSSQRAVSDATSSVLDEDDREREPRRRPKPMPKPTDNLVDNVVEVFTGVNLLYFGGAVAATGLMVESGIDHEVHIQFDGHLEAGDWNSLANIGGYVVPALTAPAIWIAGWSSRNRRLAGAGSAAVQALAVTMAATGTLKLASGRLFPVHEDWRDDSQHADKFRPFQNGFAAWPSGHTSSTISIAAALTAYAPEHRWIPFVGYPLGLGLGLGMVDRDSHWASDWVAGALIGHAIGYSIGKSFRKRVIGGLRDGGLAFVPLSGDANGAAVNGVAIRTQW